MIDFNNDRRLGRIRITFQTFRDSLEVIRALFVELEFVTLHIQTQLHENLVEYYGTSPKFRFVLEGEKIPLYKIQIERSTVQTLKEGEEISQDKFSFSFEEVSS